MLVGGIPSLIVIFFHLWGLQNLQNSSKILFCVSVDGETGAYPKAALSFFLCNIMYLCLAVLGLRCCTGFSAVAASRGYSLGVLHRHLTATASLGVKRGL